MKPNNSFVIKCVVYYQLSVFAGKMKNCIFLLWQNIKIKFPRRVQVFLEINYQFELDFKIHELHVVFDKIYPIMFATQRTEFGLAIYSLVYQYIVWFISFYLSFVRPTYWFFLPIRFKSYPKRHVLTTRYLIDGFRIWMKFLKISIRIIGLTLWTQVLVIDLITGRTITHQNENRYLHKYCVWFFSFV